MKILWRSQGSGRIKKQRKMQISLRMIIIIIGVIIIVAITILACILAILHPEYTNQIIVVTSIAGVAAGILTAFLQSASSHKETPNREEGSLSSDTTRPAINQSPQEPHARIVSTQPLKNEPASVDRAPEQVVTKPLHAISSFYNPEDIFHFNQKLLKASDFYGRKAPS